MQAGIAQCMVAQYIWRAQNLGRIFESIYIPQKYRVAKIGDVHVHTISLLQIELFSEF